MFSPAPELYQVSEPQQTVAVVAVETHGSHQPSMSPQMIQRIASLQIHIDDYPLDAAERYRWSFELAAVEMLARHAQGTMAERRLVALEQEVSANTDRYFQHHGAAYLQQAQQFSFLNDEQAGRLRAAEFAAEQGLFQDVYPLARALVRELWAADAWITARSGDTLARIAARPQVYDNANLWPLIRAANKGYFYRQNQPQAGWRLRYPLHPRLDEIFAAVEGQLN